MKKRGRKQFGFYQDEKAVIEIVKLKSRRRRDGKTPSYRQIASELNAEGHKTQSGRQFAAQTVKNIILAIAGGQAVKRKKQVRKTSLGTCDYLTRKQLRLVCGVCRDQRDEIIVAMLVGAGLRASEACALEIRDLGIFGGKSQIDVRRGKGSKQRVIFISPELAEKLRVWVRAYRNDAGAKGKVLVTEDWTDMNYDTLYKRVKKIGILAAMSWLHPHCLRHTFATLLYDNRKDVFFVKEQLGHASIATTEIYAKTLTKDKLEQMKSFGREFDGLFSGQTITETIREKRIKDINDENKGS